MYLFLGLAIFNTLISMIISFPLLHQHEGALLLGLIPFIAHYFTLNLAQALILYMLSLIIGKISIFNVIVFSLFQLILIIDTRIFTIFHYHLNSLVWNIITVEGVTDSVTLGKGTIMFFSIIALLIIIAEIVLNIYIKKAGNSLKRGIRLSLIAGLLLILLDKGLYAYGDLFNKVEITSNSRLYPLYQPFTIKRFASRVLGINVNREDRFKLNVKSHSINYPLAPLKLDPTKNKKFNILIIAVEGLRFDMFNPEIMPEVWKFSKRAKIFKNHYSGGNGSRFGLFTLLYGLNGSYWHSFLANRISPVMIDTLIDLGYEFKILSSTRLTFPEFRKTAFIRIPDAITDTFETGLSYERDRIITEDFIEFISKRDNSRPFFSFMFFDSSHQPYLYPEKFEKFKPVLPKSEINYFRDVSKDRVYLIKNRYKNSVYYEDHLIGRILNELKNKGLLKNIIIVITGDHGEEFYEANYFGHTSAFNDYQCKVPFVLYHPEGSQEIIEDMTSHIDLVPTIMDSLGVLSLPGNYSQGISLLKREKRPFVIVANWDTSAIVDNEYRIIYSTETQAITKFEVRWASDYSLVKDHQRILKDKIDHLKKALELMSEFYR